MNTPINFELAKLLKEIGYDKPTILHRDLEGNLPFNYNECFIKENWNHNPYLFSAPTIAEVVMWLYEKRGIWISVNYDQETQWYYNIVHISEKGGNLVDKFNSLTEAYEAAIEYALSKNSDKLLNFVIDLVDTIETAHFRQVPLFSISSVIDYINNNLLTKHYIKISGKKIQIIKKQ